MKMHMTTKKSLLLAVLLSIGLAGARAQGPEGGRRNLPPGENVVGKVTSVSKDSLVVAPVTGGDPITIKVGDSTRVLKAREPIAFSEIKNDDLVFARGELKDRTMQALLVSVVPPEALERMRQGGGGGMMFGGPGGRGGPGEQFKPEDMGKKFIAGEVKAINETKLTIARPDGETQDIEVDETTSFRKGRESITLPDIKVGDFVFGRGELKNAIFVPQTLNVGDPRRRTMVIGGEGNQPQQKKPDTAKPAGGGPPKN
jgi:hypothetical protein